MSGTPAENSEGGAGEVGDKGPGLCGGVPEAERGVSSVVARVLLRRARRVETSLYGILTGLCRVSSSWLQDPPLSWAWVVGKSWDRSRVGKAILTVRRSADFGTLFSTHGLRAYTRHASSFDPQRMRYSRSLCSAAPKVCTQ